MRTEGNGAWETYLSPLTCAVSSRSFGCRILLPFTIKPSIKCFLYSRKKPYVTGCWNFTPPPRNVVKNRPLFSLKPPKLEVEIYPGELYRWNLYENWEAPEERTLWRNSRRCWILKRITFEKRFEVRFHVRHKIPEIFLWSYKIGQSVGFIEKICWACNILTDI